MITQVPDYPAAPEQTKPVESAIAQAGALAEIKPPKPMPITPTKVVAGAPKPDPTRPKPPASVKLPANTKPQVAVHTFPHGRSG
jgi:hypothetical protein